MYNLQSYVTEILLEIVLWHWIDSIRNKLDKLADA